MATMDRSKGDAVGRSGSGAAVLVPRLLAAAVVAALGAPAAAQQWSFDASIAARLSSSSNSNLGSATDEGDTILNLRPRFEFRRTGGRLNLAGSFDLNAFSYFDGTQPSRLLPAIGVNGRLEAVERFFFVEAEARALQTSNNPFGANPDGESANANTVTTTVYRVSPYIERDVSPDFRYGLRSDNTKTGDYGSTFSLGPSASSGRFSRHVAYAELDPVPFGWRLEAERSDTRYDDSTQAPQVLELARASVNYTIGADLSAGVRAGYERNSLLVGEERDNRIYGVQFRWRPSERTDLSAYREHRFFGSSWRVAFDHRMPWLAWNLVFSRGVETAPQLLFELPAVGNVASQLDAMFTTRFPDPVERARVVQEFIASRGLPSTTQRAMNLYSQRLTLVTTRSGSVGYVGPRTSVTLSGYATRVEDALGDTPLTTDATLNNNRQRGVALVINRRLSRLSSVTLEFDYSHIRALEAIGPDSTKQATGRMRFSLQTAPRTNAFFGGGYRKLASNVVVGGEEVTAFAGIDHTF